MKRDQPSSRHFLGWIKRRRWFLVLGMTVLALSVATLMVFKKSEKGFAPGETIEIAVVYTPEQDSKDFLAAISIAVDQVNARGGILGHPVAARLFEEDSYDGTSDLGGVVSKTMRLASRIGSTSSILAVVGHGSSATAVPASAIYNRHKKLFMATHATAASLSNLRFDMTFAMQPNNADNANMLASYAIGQGLRRTVVLSDDSNYGVETTNQFRSFYSQGGGTILLHTRQFSSGRSVEDLLLYLLDNDLFNPKDVDAFFITSSNNAETAKFILRARQLGLRFPILGPEYLYSNEVEEMAGGAAMKDVVSVTVFNDENVSPESELLSQPFKKITGHKPGLLAATGFDAIKVLAYAAEKAGSLDQELIADTLRIIRYESPFIGASGPLAFDTHGMLTDTSAYVIRHDGTRFRTVATFRNPFIHIEDESRTAPSTKPASERNPKP